MLVTFGLQEDGSVCPMGGLPYRCTQDKIVHVSLPRLAITEVDLLGTYIEIGEIVALQGLDFERGGMSAEMGDDVSVRGSHMRLMLGCRAPR